MIAPPKVRLHKLAALRTNLIFWGVTCAVLCTAAYGDVGLNRAKNARQREAMAAHSVVSTSARADSSATKP